MRYSVTYRLHPHARVAKRNIFNDGIGISLCTIPAIHESAENTTLFPAIPQHEMVISLGLSRYGVPTSQSNPYAKLERGCTRSGGSLAESQSIVRGTRPLSCCGGEAKTLMSVIRPVEWNWNSSIDVNIDMIHSTVLSKVILLGSYPSTNEGPL